MAEELFKQRIKGFKNRDGVWTTPTFPKLIYVLEEDNIREDSKYYWLTELAAKCTAKRMVPDYISEKKAIELKGTVVIPMGCRSLSNINYSPKLWGTLNLGVCSINLPHIALSSKGNPEEFWKIFDERMNLLFKAQISRYNKLKGTLSDVAPILWQHGALARLKEGEVIDKYLLKEYSTISVGYVGLAECVKYMTGLSHINDKALEFAKQVMKKLNEYCDKWTKETDLGWGVYGTPKIVGSLW